MLLIGFIFGADDQIIIACNTAHLLVPELETRFGIRFTSLVSATCQQIRNSGFHTMGLLASPTTISSGLYEIPLQKSGVTVVKPSSEGLKCVENIIRQVIAGKEPSRLRKKLRTVVRDLQADGAEAIIVGCSELSIIFGNQQENNVIDPFHIISEVLLYNETDD